MSHSEFILRNYKEEDAQKIGEFNKVLEMSYQYNGDFKPENIICAVNSGGDIYAVGHLEPHDTWNLITKEAMSSEFIYKLRLEVTTNPSMVQPEGISDAIMKALINRAGKFKELYPNRKIRLIKFVRTEEKDVIDYYLSKGYTANHTIFVMKRDLAEDIPEVPEVPGVRIENWLMPTQEEKIQYLEAEAEANSGVCWSINLLWWYSFGPEWGTFAAFSGDQLIGSTMTWLITEERSASENIFVIPEWRKKGVARLMITEALKHLKKQGKTMATLCVYGENKSAIALYKSLGYKLYDTMIEFGYDLF